MTMLGTVIEEGAAQVFVGGPPAAVTSDGAFYSPSGAAATAAAKGAAAAAAEKAAAEKAAAEKAAAEKAAAEKAAAEKAAAEKAVPKVDELVKNPRVVSDMPAQVAVSAEMDQRMNEMAGMEKGDPKSGELHEFGAAIGIDADGNLHMGATQDLGPNGVNGLDRSKIPVGTTFAGDFHSHPGDIPTAFSGLDGDDFNAGVRNNGQSISIVQSGNSRFLVIIGTDTQVPDVFSPPAPEHSIMNRPVNSQADADARLDANTDYWNDSNVGFYGGNTSGPLSQISPSVEGEKGRQET